METAQATTKFVAAIVIVAIVAVCVGYLVGRRVAPVSEVPVLPTLPEKIKVGSLMALTGFLGPMGEEIVKGVQLAVKEANAMGGIAGRQIELIVEDTETDPAKALEAAKKLVEVDGVKVIIGPMASGEVRGIGKYCNDGEVVVISPSATSPLVTVELPDDFIFRTVGSDAFQGRAMAEIIVKENHKKVAILVIDNPYGVGIENEAKKVFAGKVAVVTTIRYDPAKRDFRTELGEIKAAKPDAVLYVGYYEDGRVMFRQALELGLDAIPWICAEGIYGEALIKEDGVVHTDVAEFLLRAGKGTRPVAPVVSGYEAFKAKFIAEYGKEPPMYSDTAYDATWLAISAIAQAGEYDGAKIRSALKSISQFFIGASGVKGFDVNGDQAMQTYEIWTVKKIGVEYKFVGIGMWP